MQNVGKSHVRESRIFTSVETGIKYCPSCDSQNEFDSMFCAICGEVLKGGSFQSYPQMNVYSMSTTEDIHESNVLVLASWSSRFIAFLLDGIAIIIIGGIITSFLGPLALLVPFAYLAIFEYYFGATLGKMVLKLKVVDEETGEKPTNFVKICISNLGKIFLLPIDVLLGLIIKECSEKNQRIFQRASDLVVIKDR
ncbi:MAG: RDD family protein [Candidatus Hermodarchaeota archaeon]